MCYSSSKYNDPFSFSLLSAFWFSYQNLDSMRIGWTGGSGVCSDCTDSGVKVTAIKNLKLTNCSQNLFLPTSYLHISLKFNLIKCFWFFICKTLLDYRPKQASKSEDLHEIWGFPVVIQLNPLISMQSI